MARAGNRQFRGRRVLTAQIEKYAIVLPKWFPASIKTNEIFLWGVFFQVRFFRIYKTRRIYFLSAFSTWNFHMSEIDRLTIGDFRFGILKIVFGIRKWFLNESWFFIYQSMDVTLNHRLTEYNIIKYWDVSLEVPKNVMRHAFYNIGIIHVSLKMYWVKSWMYFYDFVRNHHIV